MSKDRFTQNHSTPDSSITDSLAEAPRCQSNFQFSGNGFEYFRIWIVNILLSIVTLGIYSAWAKVRTKRYFYGNTFLDNSNFEYHAKPIQILKGRIIAFAALIIVMLLNEIHPAMGIITTVLLILAAPFIIWSALRFNAKVSSYRNVPFSFHGNLGKAYKYLLILPIIPAFVLGMAGFGLSKTGVNSSIAGILVSLGLLSICLMIPYVQAMFYYYYINGSNFGQGEFRAEIKPSFFYVTYLKLIGWSIVWLIIISISVAAIAAISGALNAATFADIQSRPGSLLALGPLLLLIYLPFIMFGIWSKAYLQVNVRNYTLNQTQLDDTLSFKSNLTTSRLFTLQLVNLFLIIFTLGLAWPWVKVRLARYSADSLNVEISEELAGYVTEQQRKQSALSDEMGEAFDMDADLGLTL
ncbi:MAG: YjgN family protein [Marinobacterium sp.]|nr:YjgN family protein [Marinobacterium sp.]